MSHPDSQAQRDQATGASRRNFLIATGAGAAAAGVAAGLPLSTGHSAGGAAGSVSIPGDAQPLVAHIADPASGAISLLVAGREVVVHDADLVARLVRAAAKGE